MTIREPNTQLALMALMSLAAPGCSSCPDLSAPDTGAYQIDMAVEALSDSAYSEERPDILGGLIIEEGDSLRVLYHRSTGELVEVTYRRIPEGETGP